MALIESISTDRRRQVASPKLVVVDLSSLVSDIDGAIEPSELAARSIIVRTMAEARRDGDVFIVSAPVELSWAVSELFPGAAMFIEDPNDPEGVELTGQFLDRQRTGGFGELVIVSGSRRFLDIAEMFRDSGRTVRVISQPSDCDIVLNGESDLTLWFPSEFAA